MRQLEGCDKKVELGPGSLTLDMTHFKSEIHHGFVWRILDLRWILPRIPVWRQVNDTCSPVRILIKVGLKPASQYYVSINYMYSQTRL